MSFVIALFLRKKVCVGGKVEELGMGRTEEEVKEERLVAFECCGSGGCVPGMPAAKLYARPGWRMQPSVVANLGATSTSNASVVIRGEVGPKACPRCLKITGAGRTCRLVVRCSNRALEKL